MSAIKELKQKNFQCTKKIKDQWSELFTNYVNSFIAETFVTEMPKIEVTVNGRLSSTLAQFRLYTSKSTRIPDRYDIEVSAKVTSVINSQNSNPKLTDLVAGVLRHEAIHYALYFLGENFNDGGYLFESILAATNSPSSMSTKKSAKVKGHSDFLNIGYKKTCDKCSHSIVTSFNKVDYICPKCRSEKLIKQGPAISVIKKIITDKAPHRKAKVLLKENMKKVKLIKSK